MSMAMVTSLPQLRPVYYRERGNNMYTPSVHYLVVLLTGVVTFITYPLLTGTLTFRILGFTDDSWENYGNWMKVETVMALSGMCFGFMIGTFFDDKTGPTVV